MGTAHEELYEDVKNVLYTNSAVPVVAGRISMGLLMVGIASEKANDTQHENIIRCLTLGIALTVYDREEEGDTLTEQMTRYQEQGS